ncbi:MAG TPA: hypothetical protein PKA88_24975, partial [Polyangiaceae bacterium]|nr:hypothetical protein [Polyangiaceae bacterium]
MPRVKGTPRTLRVLASVARTLLACYVLLPSPAEAASAIGAPCALPAECDSGFCADGVCCNVACAGVCESCAAKWKQSAKDHGTCGPVRAGTDPDGDCSTDAPSSCAQTGQCAGTAAKCALYPTGTACGATSCILNNTVGMICDGQGSCYSETTPLPCASGKVKCLPDAVDAGVCASACPGQCASPCTASTDCVETDEECLGGTCVKKLPVGAACSQSGDCVSSNCTDGVCCDKPCQGQCQRCDTAGKLGTCSLVTGAGPVAPRPACAGTPPCQGTCAGLADKCSYPDQGTACGSASCAGDSLLPADRCDGTGACVTSVAKDCGDYGCDPVNQQCFTTCTTSAQCAGTNACDVSSGSCVVVGNSCADAWSVKTTDGTVSSCGGYRCVVGKCQQQCSDGTDCAPGYACAGGQCLPTGDAGLDASGGGTGGSAGSHSTPTQDAEGCGCRVVGSP